MKRLDVAAAVLLVIGGLNWGLIGLGGPDIVAALFGQASGLSRAVYLLVGLSAVWQALQWKAIQHRWLSRPRAAVAVAVLALIAVSPLHAQMAADLITTLSGKGPFTVFAPTDAAFEKLPAGTVPALLEDKATLTSVLTYHVVAGRLSAADLKARADKDGYVTLETVQGGDLRIHLAGAKVHVGEQFANVTAADVAASNGIIHVIDAVLSPTM